MQTNQATWSWRVFHSTFRFADSARKLFYHWRLSLGSSPLVFQEITLKVNNTIDAVYPEGISAETQRELSNFIHLCVIHSSGMNILAQKIQESISKWEKRQRRPRWKQYIVDVSPIHWFSHLLQTRICKKTQISPIVHPAVSIEESNQMFDLIASHLGKSYFFLEDLIFFMHQKPKPDEEELLMFLKRKYIQFLAMYHPRLGQLSPAELSLHIKEQIEKLEDQHFNTDHLSEVNQAGLDIVGLSELVHERMKIYLVELRREVKKRKYVTSSWIRNLSIALVITIVCMKVNAYGFWNLVSLVREEAASLLIVSSRFYQTRMKEPITRIYRTIRYDEVSLGINASVANLESERKALATMVVDYLTTIHPDTFKDSENLNDVYQTALDGDLSMIMEDYARAVKSPIQQLLFGELMQMVLIQVHKLKVDAEKGVVVMDQLMRANELNFQLLALFPAFLLVGVGFRWIYTKMYPGTSPVLITNIRHQFREVSRIINSYNTGKFKNNVDKPSQKQMSFKDIGRLVYYINRVQILAKQLPPTEKQYLLSDSQELLDSTFSIPQKLVTVDRIYYNIGSINRKSYSIH